MKPKRLPNALTWHSDMPDTTDLSLDSFLWYFSTKEGLLAHEVLVGLLDHGLFAEKCPPCFTSVGLAAAVSEKLAPLLEKTAENDLSKGIGDCAHDYVRYESLRDINIPRHLGIPHPEAYAVQALAISKHWKEIAKHCNKPTPAISRIHVQHVGNGCIFEMSYKGSERYKHEEEEIHWRTGAQFVVVADVASCFPSIYTHSIPWVLHGKEAAKKSGKLTELTGNLLDKCTQITRDRQTNGLLIGPHASNIISEIVLTEIDAEIQAKGHKKVVRHVDDYTFYADSFDEAERFVKDLGMSLRRYEMSLNDKKTRIHPLPKPSIENWINTLNRFNFPKGEEVRFSAVRSFLDLALECAQQVGKSTPLNYAIKTLSGWETPLKLNARAMRLYSQEAMNLALSYPYLVPFLDEFVFDKYWHDGLRERIGEFSTSLVKLGVRKLYPDTVAHALHFALKHGVKLGMDEMDLMTIVKLDDCLSNVLLLEYALSHELIEVKQALAKRGDEIKLSDRRERDKNWMLIYQLWSVEDLQGNGQALLADLKSKGFKFLVITKRSAEQSVEEESSLRSFALNTLSPMQLADK